MNILKKKPKPEVKNNVLLGKGNWAFLFQGHQHQFDYLMGEKKVSSSDVENFVGNIASRTAYFDSTAIIYKHLVFPSKPIVQKSLLLPPYNNIESVFRRYYQRPLKAKHLDVLYPLKELRQKEAQSPTFSKYNTHNSDIGYLEIVNQLCRNTDIPELPETLFEKTKQPLGGDLSRMLGANDTSKETVLNVVREPRMYRFSNQPYLPGNTNNVFIFHNDESITPKRLLIFGDSFFQGAIRFLRLLFSDILFVRSTFVHRDMVEQYQPDVVFTGNAERYLARVKSDTEANHFMLALYGEPRFAPNKHYLNALQAMMSYRYYPHLYQQWLESIRNAAHVNAIGNSPAVNNPSILHDVAVYFEKEGDPDTALKIMKEAKRLRPDNPSFATKYNEYLNETTKWR
ncbi:MAG: hypothetical protein JXX29_15490 [Deltaproteobacteria bacterium]|nr:hypothetical protein [Deltaproteobacteria bacterium]MBN2673086.1 hypothetical protein [Deltaproteobacteria bacterium]